MIDLTPLKALFKNAPVAVFGLGLSGMASLDALLKAGFTVHVWDDNPERRQEAEKRGAQVIDLAGRMQPDTACLVLAPGVPLTHPEPHAVVKKAQSLDVEILSDIELFHRAMPHARTIGITGTNGKSTTTALIAHILKEAGKAVDVGGNLGKPMLAFDPLLQDGWYVIELSSYQIDLCPTFRPDIGILLNITPDHLDRHGDLAGYAKAKSRLFGQDTFAIISMDDAPSAHIFETVPSRDKQSLSVQDGADITFKDGILTDGALQIDLRGLPHLKGTHNFQNAAAAYAACRHAGIAPQDIEKALHSFPGLAHRQNIVRVIDGITFVNDSKATNDEAAAKALSSFENIYWIAGGKPKGKHYPECEKFFHRIRRAYLIGGGTDDLSRALSARNIENTHSKIIHAAVFQAYEDALSDINSGTVNHAVILLSPACASFDQFKSFEQRGQVFTACVEYLPRRLPDPKGDA